MNLFLPVIAKAIAALPEKTEEARLEVYSRARIIALEAVNSMHFDASGKRGRQHLKKLEEAIQDLEQLHRQTSSVSSPSPFKLWGEN